MPRISSRRQVTLPAESLEHAGLQAGDDVVVEAEAPGRIVIRRLDRDRTLAFGVFDGLYEPGYLARLRAEESARTRASSARPRKGRL